MIRTSQLKNGIEFCLDNGKRLLDDGLFLQQNKRYSSAIPLFILGYEEINKAVFMEDKYFKKEDVSTKEYENIFKGGSHSNKIKMHYSILKNQFEKMSDNEFHAQKTFVESRSKFMWHNNRNDALNQINNALLIITKLNEMKKQFLYVDYYDTKWQTHWNKFSDKVLDSLCTVLYHVAIESFFRIRLYMDWEKMGIYAKNLALDSEDGNKGFKSRYFIELEKLQSTFSSSKWINARNIATKMITSI